MQWTILWFLLCPITMGAMMWLMMRSGMHSDGLSRSRIAELERQVNRLRSAERERAIEPDNL